MNRRPNYRLPLLTVLSLTMVLMAPGPVAAQAAPPTGDYIHNTRGIVQLGLVQPDGSTLSAVLPVNLKIALDAIWGAAYPTLNPLVEQAISAKGGDQLTDVVSEISLTDQAELRVKQDGDTLTLKYVIHNNKLWATVVLPDPAPDPRLKLRYDLDIVLSVRLPGPSQPFAITNASAYIRNSKIDAENFAAVILKAIADLAFDGEEFINSQSLSLTDKINGSLAPITNAIDRYVPSDLIYHDVSVNQVGTISLCFKLSPDQGCAFPTSTESPPRRRVMGYTEDNCSEGKIWIKDVEKDRLMPVTRAQLGTEVEVNWEFAWYCGNNDAPNLDNDERTANDTDGDLPSAVRIHWWDPDGREIQWHFLDWRSDTPPPPLPVAPPTTSIDTTGVQPGPSGWYTDDVQLAFASSGGQDGVARTLYRLDGGPETEATGPVTVAGDGIHTMTYYSVDNGGQRELPQTQTFKIDGTPPLVALQASGIPTATWTLAASDALSGIDPASAQVSFDGSTFQPYTQPIPLELHPRLWASIADLAGNRAAAQPLQWLDITSDSWVVREVERDAPTSKIVDTTIRSEAGATNRHHRIPVEPGGVYQTKVMVRGSDVLSMTKLIVVFHDDDGDTIESATLPGPGGTFDWSPIEGLVTAPAGAASAEIDMHLSGWGRAWFDDVVFAAATAPEVNLAADPGFEQTVDSPWDLRRRKAENALFFLVNDGPHTGAQSVLVTASELKSGSTGILLSGGDSDGVSQVRMRPAARLAAQPGQQYTVTAWARTRDSSAQVELVFRTADGERLLVETGDRIDNRTDWTPLNVTATAPAGAATVEVRISVQGGGRAWLDDIFVAGAN